MPITDVQICNWAALYLGTVEITALSDTDKIAKKCSLRYDGAKESVLTMHPWSEAVSREVISKDATAPAFGYEARFTLPTDCLRPLMVYSNGVRYTGKRSVEGGYILCNLDTIQLIFVKNISEGLMRAHLADSIAAYLAWDTAYSIVQENNASERLWETFQRKYRYARTQNAQQGDVLHYIIADDFVNSRLDYDFPDRSFNSFA